MGDLDAMMNAVETAKSAGHPPPTRRKYSGPRASSMGSIEPTRTLLSARFEL
jgi:hypothetical protein